MIHRMFQSFSFCDFVCSFCCNILVGVDFVEMDGPVVVLKLKVSGYYLLLLILFFHCDLSHHLSFLGEILASTHDCSG